MSAAPSTAPHGPRSGAKSYAEVRRYSHRHNNLIEINLNVTQSNLKVNTRLHGVKHEDSNLSVQSFNLQLGLLCYTA